MVSCSESSESTKENINDKYLSQAHVFIQSKIDKANKGGDTTIDRFDQLKIDSIIVLSSQKVEGTKMQPLWDEYNTEKKYLDKLVEIDRSYGGEPDRITIAAREKCMGIIDSLVSWEDRMKLLPQNDTLGYGVQFMYDLKQSDGVYLKERSFIIYFDENHDINGDWNR